MDQVKTLLKDQSENQRNGVIHIQCQSNLVRAYQNCYYWQVWDLQHKLQIIKHKNTLCTASQQYSKVCKNSPNNSLSSWANGLEVLITLQYCEFSIADLHSVKHGGEPGGHLGSEERHAWGSSAVAAIAAAGLALCKQWWLWSSGLQQTNINTYEIWGINNDKNESCKWLSLARP